MCEIGTIGKGKVSPLKKGHGDVHITLVINLSGLHGKENLYFLDCSRKAINFLLYE